MKSRNGLPKKFFTQEDFWQICDIEN
jgi:hypothetical protein